MTTATKHVPFRWDEIEDQVRQAILCQHSILQCLGPNSPELEKLYLGIDPDILEDENPARSAGLKSLPIERHGLHKLARNAYAYAYQLDGWDRATYEDHYEISCAVLQGFPHSDMDGEPSPLSPYHDFPLRRVFETFLARWNLYSPDYSHGLSVRELALLSNMTVPAARTSLSKEGFKLDLAPSRGEGSRREDDRSAMLNVADALAWLSRRRGFVPNRVEETLPMQEAAAGLFDHADLSFDLALKEAASSLGVTSRELAAKVGAPEAWLEGMMNGEAVEIDVGALRGLSRQLNMPEPEFVAKAVRHLIQLDMPRDANGGIGS